MFHVSAVFRGVFLRFNQVEMLQPSEQDECLDADVAKVSLGTFGHTTQKKGQEIKST